MKFIPAALAATALFIGTAQAQDLVDATTPEAIVDAIENQGYIAKLTKDSGGDPLIRASGDGTNWAVYFYGCQDDNTGCTAIQFHVSYGLDKGLSLKAMNEWNRDHRFGRMYLDDENDPHIEMDVNMDFGVSRDNLEDTVDYWRLVVSTVETFLSEQ